MSIENINSSETLTDEEASEAKLARLFEIRQHITRNYSLVLASLARQSGVKMRFDDESNSTHFAPETMEIVVSTQLIDQFNLGKDDQIFTTIHEYGHLSDYMQDPEFFLNVFKELVARGGLVVEAAKKVVIASGREFTSIMEANLLRQAEGALLKFHNFFDDIGVNKWAESQLPSLKDATTLDRIYSQHAFPDEKSDEGEFFGFADYTALVPHKQFQTAMLRRAMTQSSTTLISPEVDKLLNDKNISYYTYKPDKLSVTEVVQELSEMTQNRGQGLEFMPYEQKFESFLEHILPIFISIYTQDWLDALEDGKDDKTQEEIMDELDQEPKESEPDETEGDGKDNESSQNDDKQTEGKEEETQKEKKKLTNAGKDLFNSQEDINNIPSIFTPDNNAEVEKLEQTMEIFKQTSEQQKIGDQIEDPITAYYDSLVRDFPITHEEIRNYNDYLEAGKDSAKELQKVFDRLLGMHRDEGIVDSEISSSGSKINISSVIKQMTQIRNGNLSVPIYEKSVYGVAEGKMKPKEVIFQLVIDCSLSMDGQDIETMREIYAILCSGIKNYTARANIKSGAEKSKFVRLRTQVWRYGNEVQEIKPLSNYNSKVDDTPHIIEAFKKIRAERWSTDDRSMIKALSNSINKQRFLSSKLKVETDTQNVILYFTDGGTDDTSSMIKVLSKAAQTHNTIWRGFHISDSQSSDFNLVWNKSGINNVRGQSVSTKDLVKVFVEQFREILE